MDKKNLHKLLTYLLLYKRDMIIVMSSLLCVSFSLLMIGKGFKQLVDSGLSTNYLVTIDYSLLFVSFLIVLLSIGSFFRSYFINNLAEKIVNKIRVETYNNLINQEIFKFEELKMGDIISRLTSDMELISKLIVNFLSFFIRNSIMLIGGVTLMFMESYKLALIVVIGIPLLLLPIIKFGKYVRILSKKTLEAGSDISSDIEESFANIRAIHSFSQQPNKIESFNQRIISYLQLSDKRLKIRALFFSLSIAIILTAIIAVIWVGSIDIVNGHLTAGQMISFVYYAIVAGVSCGGIFELLSELHSPLVALDRIFELTNSSNSMSLTKIESKNKILGTIELKKLYFSYPSRPELLILNNMSFKIEAGKFIGVVGRSGSGKTSIMQLLLKLYFPNKGVIKIGGYNIADINTSQLREIIAYAPQEPAIFSGTIKSNIVFARPGSNESEILQVAQITGITEFTRNIKKGLDAEIGEKGVRLSGGQKQRISLARALLCKPEILLLDEAMSALDRESEEKLLESIKILMKGKTIISIAHRIASIEQADEILLIDNGELIDRGKHSQLLASSDMYRVICQEELLGSVKLSKKI